jgi:hypothetical protein
MNKRLFFVLCFFVCLLLHISCRTKQLAVSEPSTNQPAEDLMTLMKKNQFRYKTLSLKFNAEVQSGEETNSFSGNIYIVKDTTIWISIQKLGMEAFRMLIKPDSVKMLDRINKVYMAGDYFVLNRMLNSNFDFDLLQALFTGNDTDHYETAGFVTEKINDTYILSNKNRKKQAGGSFSESMDQKIMIRAGDYKIVKNIMKKVTDTSSKTIEVTYSEFLGFEGQKFPQKIDFQLSDTRTINASIVYTRITPEKKESFPFSVPATYSIKN